MIAISCLQCGTPAARADATAARSLTRMAVGASGSHIGSGGAMTQVDAARLAAVAGVRVTVTATPLLERLIAGERLGTEFEPNPDPEG